MPLHAFIRRLRGQGDGRGIIFNRSEEWISERVIEPWNRGEDIVVNGEHWNPRDIQISLYETDMEIDAEEGSLTGWSEMKLMGRSRTDELIVRAAGNAASTGDPIEFAEDRRSVMVVHGRNSAIRDAMFTFLRAIDLRPLEWSELVGAASGGAPYIGDVLDAAFARCQAVVVISTPDDIVYLREDLVPPGDPEDELAHRGQARPNVFFEAGMAMGRFPSRTILTEIGALRPASDLAGRHAVRLGGNPECRSDLAQRLRDAGCEVNSDGSDWLSVGDFEPPSDIGMSRQPQANEHAGLARRIDAFIGDLPAKGYATKTTAQTYNELVDESGIDGVERAGSMTRMSSMSSMTVTDMRMLLNQVKAQL